MKRLLCYIWRHKWNKTLDEVPAGHSFHRIDCTRCGFAIDGAALRRIRDENPALYEYTRFYMP